MQPAQVRAAQICSPTPPRPQPRAGASLGGKLRRHLKERWQPSPRLGEIAVGEEFGEGWGAGDGGEQPALGSSTSLSAQAWGCGVRQLFGSLSLLRVAGRCRLPAQTRFGASSWGAGGVCAGADGGALTRRLAGGALVPPSLPASSEREFGGYSSGKGRVLTALDASASNQECQARRPARSQSKYKDGDGVRAGLPSPCAVQMAT